MTCTAIHLILTQHQSWSPQSPAHLGGSPVDATKLRTVLSVASFALIPLAGCQLNWKQDVASPPATVSEQPHSGPFATGASLSFDAVLRPLDPSPVKEIRIDASNKLIDLAPGVKYSAWTLGNQVPGPSVHVRVGDKIRFSMTNRTNEVMPRTSRIAAPMMHSMDFHSAMGSPQGIFHSIGPGQTISFEFTPTYPGVFMYHCVTPPMVEHVASGMYGVMVVEPKGGFPTKADREYVIVQSEFYTKPDPERRKVENTPVYVLNREKALARSPTYVVFNGRFNGMVDKPLFARPGDRVRLFVLNVGPGSTSSFHVVGTIFDRVWLDGNPENELRGMQTVLLGSSSSAIVEFVIPEKGDYILVDHHFANAAIGAIGVISASDTAALESNDHPPAAAMKDPDAAKGNLTFESKCVPCHSVGSGDKIGPDLLGVTRRHADTWLTKWLLAPEKMQKNDPVARALVAKYKVPMPNPGLSRNEVQQILKYFHWSDRHDTLVKD
jgi:nitrite reductase (NO-forming)